MKMSGPYDQDFCLKFRLSDFYNQDLKEFLDPIDNEKVCVVSVIGKSSLGSQHFKTSIIGEALNRNIHEPTEDKKSPLDVNGEITGYYDAKSKVIFLNLYAVTDIGYLMNMCKKMENDIMNKSFLETWSHLQFHYAKVVLLLFNLSHIVIVVHPNSSFDMSYVYLFQTLNEIRFRALPWLSEVLKSLNVSAEWIQGGRPCSPRALFVFESCPLENTMENISSSLTAGSGKLKPKKVPPLKTLEHSLEDQIYRILRKSRVITNVSGNSLFAIPANQEFVYVFSSKPYISDPVDFFLKQLHMHCQLAKENDITVAKSGSSQRNSTPSPVTVGSSFGSDIFDCTDGTSSRSFGKFLHQHVTLAHLKGFDDNVGRHPVPAHFELPFIHTWFRLAAKVLGEVQGELKDNESQPFLYDLKAGLDYDVRFSDCQCRKVRSLASNTYRENLPIHYTKQFHETRLAYAVDVFNLHARGPAAQRYLQQLKDDCEKLWMNGRQMCEVLSLTGNHCVNAKHRTEDDDDDIMTEEEEKNLQVMSHCSQVKIVSACNCGRKQASREDPFDLKVANHDFYVTQFSHCCGELEKIDFPVFQASSDESHPAHISPVHVSKGQEANEDMSKVEQSSANSSLHGSNTLKADLSGGGNSETCSLANDVDHPPADDHSQSQAEDGPNEIIISIQDGEDSSSSKEKMLTRQPSTTEYLPGMLHSGSPPGLLPLFSSWSLVCVGPSSLYSHNIGLQDQPGFIPGTNFLLPWDVTVKVEHKEKWPTLWEGKKPMGMKGKKSSRDGAQFNVKIFIGVEYECYRGHRFMCSGPERVLRATSSGLVKDNALKVTSSDMPLYFPCPCRASKPQIAQLMRIHVVTPKAPVHITLNPKVQPAADPCSVFSPTMNEPLKLSQSSYWVLRFPFAYVGDQEVYYPPRETVGLESGRLLKGTYNIAEQQSDR